MELSLIGLQNAGKTSLVNVIAVSSSLTFESLCKVGHDSTRHKQCLVSFAYIILYIILFKKFLCIY